MIRRLARLDVLSTLAPLALLPLLVALPLPAFARAEDLDLPAQTAREVAPIFVTGIVFSITAVIVAMVLYARHRARRLRFETIQFAIEKGAAVPTNLLVEGREGRPDPAQDLRRGLLLLGFGAGLSIMLKTLPGSGEVGAWSIGAVPGLLGVGYLVTHALVRRQAAAPAATDLPQA